MPDHEGQHSHPPLEEMQTIAEVWALEACFQGWAETPEDVVAVTCQRAFYSGASAMLMLLTTHGEKGGDFAPFFDRIHQELHDFLDDEELPS